MTTITETIVGHINDTTGFRRTTGKTYSRPPHALVVVTQPQNSGLAVGDVVTARPCENCGGWWATDEEGNTVINADEFFGAEVNPTGRTGDWYAALLGQDWSITAVGKAEYQGEDRVRVTVADGTWVEGTRWVAVDKPYREIDYHRYVIGAIMYAAKDYGYGEAVRQMQALLAEQAPELMPLTTAAGTVTMRLDGADNNFRVSFPTRGLEQGETAEAAVDNWVATNFPTARIVNRDITTSMSPPEVVPAPENPTAHHRKVMAAIQRVGNIIAQANNMCSVYEDVMRRHGWDPKRGDAEPEPVEWEATFSGRYPVKPGDLTLPEGLTSGDAYISVTGSAAITVPSTASATVIHEATRTAAYAMGLVDGSVSVSQYTPKVRLF